MAVPKPMLTEYGIHYRLESCGVLHLGFCTWDLWVFLKNKIRSGIERMIVLHSGGVSINVSGTVFTLTQPPK